MLPFSNNFAKFASLIFSYSHSYIPIIDFEIDQVRLSLVSVEARVVAELSESEDEVPDGLTHQTLVVIASRELTTAKR